MTDYDLMVEGMANKLWREEFLFYGGCYPEEFYPEVETGSPDDFERWETESEITKDRFRSLTRGAIDIVLTELKRRAFRDFPDKRITMTIDAEEFDGCRANEAVYGWLERTLGIRE